MFWDTLNITNNKSGWPDTLGANTELANTGFSFLETNLLQSVTPINNSIQGKERKNRWVRSAKPTCSLLKIAWKQGQIGGQGGSIKNWGFIFHVLLFIKPQTKSNQLTIIEGQNVSSVKNRWYFIKDVRSKNKVVQAPYFLKIYTAWKSL